MDILRYIILALVLVLCAVNIYKLFVQIIKLYKERKKAKSEMKEKE